MDDDTPEVLFVQDGASLRSFSGMSKDTVTALMAALTEDDYTFIDKAAYEDGVAARAQQEPQPVDDIVAEPGGMIREPAAPDTVSRSEFDALVARIVALESK